MATVQKMLATSEQKQRTLLALSRFRFLTVAQFIKLGITSNEDGFRRKALGPLRDRKLIKTNQLGFQLPHVHYLTRQGAEALSAFFAQPVSDFPFPPGGAQFTERYAEHRFAQMDFSIDFQLWAQGNEYTLLAADMDFVGAGSNRRGKFVPSTSISIPNDPTPIVPDGIFAVQIPNGNRLLYVLEIHRATQTKAVSRQLLRYLKALQTDVLNQRYDVEYAPLICSVHSRENVLRGAKAQLLIERDFEAFKPLFLFNSVEQLQTVFSEGWHFADGAPARPFPVNLARANVSFAV